MTTIPGLPEHLMEVPPGPDSPSDPLAEQKRAAWRAWRDAVILDNADYHELFVTLPEHERQALIEDEIRLCKAHPAYWLTRWGTIFEPRAGKRGGGIKPFIPAAKQVDLIDWFLGCLADEETDKSDGILSKSRGVGASWVFVALAAWGWLFEDVWSVLFISWKEEFVDSKSPKSLFWKLDRLMRGLPGWMLPPGYDPLVKPSSYRQDRSLTHPQNENAITGETTTTRAARGDRMLWLMFDEMAFAEKAAPIWSGATESTDHKFGVSTESFEVSRVHYDLGIGNHEDERPALFEFDWWDLPTNDDAWVERQRSRHKGDPGAYERELRRDPHAGTTTWVYPTAWEKQPDAEVVYNPLVGNLYGGMDPGRQDAFAILWAQHDPVGNWWNVLDAYQNNKKVADFYASVVNGEMESGEWQYDDEALRLIDWTETLGPVKWWGDVFGDVKDAATNDTVYTRLAAKGIYVNRRRNTNTKEETPTMKAARTYRGRHEAVKDYLPRLRFADTPGARLMLKALQEHRYPRDETTRQNEPEKPEHDWTSHLVSALEYLFVNMKLRIKREGATRNPPGLASMGSARVTALPHPRGMTPSGYPMRERAAS
jgi:hypothetical protein